MGEKVQKYFVLCRYTLRRPRLLSSKIKNRDTVCDRAMFYQSGSRVAATSSHEIFLSVLPYLFNADEKMCPADPCCDLILQSRY